MIARELLVRLGFNIDTAKFAQFKVMSEEIKTKMSSLQNIFQSPLSSKVDQTFQKLSAYRQELKSLSKEEQKNLFDIARFESQAIKEVTSQHKQKYKEIESLEKARFAQFGVISEEIKAKTASLQKTFQSPLSSKVNQTFQKLSAYRQELKSLSKEERKDTLELNRLESQAIKEVISRHREKHKEIESLEKARFARLQKDKERFQGVLKGIGNFAKRLALVIGAASAGFAVAVKGTLDEVKAFKSQKFFGEKTSNKFDKNQLKTVDEFNSSFNETKRIIADIRNRFVIGLLPVFTELSKKFQNWIKLNRGLIDLKIKTTITTITHGIKRMTEIVTNIVEALGGWKNVLIVIKALIAGLGILKLSAALCTVGQSIKLIGTALSAFSGLRLLLNPIVLISAAVIALLLVLEDFYVFCKGGKSLIGDMIDGITNSSGWIKMKEEIQEMMKWFEKLKNLFSWGGSQQDKQTSSPPPHDGVNVTEEFISYRRRYKDLLPPAELFKHPQYPLVDFNDPYRMEKIQQPNQLLNPKIVQASPIFNLNINVPQGTLISQAQDIATLTRKEIDKAIDLFSERMLSAIGGT